ncbi:MAG: hypothetical protein P1V35_11035, partial [Planctomycetota bacterium]|nr:hypothetical protein [Planctomycetota bacterium]
MLLQAALALAPLLHNPPAPAPAAIAQESEQSLAWGVPDDALMALHWNDPKGLITNDLNNAWIAVLTDPRWIELDFWSELDVDMDDFNDFWEVAGPVLTDCTDAVAWLTGPISDTPNVYLAFRTSEDALNSLIENAPEASSRESVDGIPFVVDEDSAVGWSGDLCLVYIGEEPMEALPSLASHFQILKTQATPAGLFETTPVGSDRNDEHFEFLMDLGAIFELIMEEEGGSDDIPEAVMDELTSIEWMYASVSFGEGQALDSNIVLPYKQDGYVAKFFEFAGEANMEAFRRVPMDAVGAVIGNLDLPGLIYWVVEEMIEAEEMTAEEFEGGLEEMEGTLGFHLLEDFINNMSGELMQITFPVDDIDNEMQSMMAFTYGMLTFGMSDDEATLRALSSLMRVAEEVLEVTKATHDWGTVWDLDVMGMFQ